MHLGNGWFLTANHVSANSSISISQNGQTAKISYVDNTLNSSYGADLKLFYVEDYQSLTSLSSVSIGSKTHMRRSKQPPSDIPVQETLLRGIPTTLRTKEEPSLQLPEPALAETTPLQSTQKLFLQTACAELFTLANHHCLQPNRQTALITLLQWLRLKKVQRRL